MDTGPHGSSDRFGPEEAWPVQAEAELLRQVAEATASTDELRGLLGQVLSGCRRVLSCERAAALGLTPDRSLLTLVHVEPVSPDPPRPGRRFGRADTHVDRVLREGTGLMEVSEGVVASDRVLRVLAGDQVGWNGALLPLHAGGSDRGLLVFLNRPGGFGRHDAGMWRALGHQVAVAIQRAELTDGRRSDAERLKAFNAALKVTSGAFEEGTLLAHAVEALLSACPAERVEVLSTRGMGPSLAYSRGAPAGVRLEREAGRIEGSLHAAVMDRGEPIVLAAADRSPLASSDRLSEAYAVAVPLTVRGQEAGTLLLARSTQPFEQQEIELLIVFGRQLGLAAEHARLLAARQATTSADEVGRGEGARPASGRRTGTQRARSRWLKALGELAAGVAHDLNNALNPIVSFADLVRSRADRPELVREYAERILLAAHDGAETVRRIQRFTRRPTDESSQRPVSLARVVDEAVELTRPAWAERTVGGAIGMVQSVESDLRVGTSAAELRQSLLNLISNSLDAMTTGGELRLIGRQEGDEVMLAIQDTGIGMSGDVLDQALEPFFTTKGTRGTGLGLSEVYGIARRQGGGLEIESWPGVGTTVLLRLPAKSTAPRGTQMPRARALAVQTSRILVVDDNVLGLEALAAALRNAGHAVVTASSGEAALRVFEPSRFSVVLTDVGMPDLNGWELLDELRQRDPDVRLGVVTGWAMERNDQELRQRGIDLVFLKPVNIDELLGAL